MLTPTSFEPRHWSGFMWVMNWPECDAAAPELALLEELLVWASAGAAMRAVATRHAAICFFSMGSSWTGCTKSLRFRSRITGETAKPAGRFISLRFSAAQLAAKLPCRTAAVRAGGCSCLRDGESLAADLHPADDALAEAVDAHAPLDPAIAAVGDRGVVGAAVGVAVAVIGRGGEGAEREPADEPGRDRAAAVIRPIAVAAPIGRTVAPAAAPRSRAIAAPAAAPMAAPLRFRRSRRADHRGAERQRRDGAENRPLRFREGKSHGECPCFLPAN